MTNQSELLSRRLQLFKEAVEANNWGSKAVLARHILPLFPSLIDAAAVLEAQAKVSKELLEYGGEHNACLERQLAGADAGRKLVMRECDELRDQLAAMREALEEMAEAYKAVVLSEFETYGNPTPYDTPPYQKAMSALGRKAEGG